MTVLLAALPPVMLAATTASLARVAGWRTAVLLALATVGVWVAALTELLSATHSLSRTPVAAAWAVGCAVSIGVAIRRLPFPGRRRASGRSRPSRAALVLAAAAGALVGATLVTAIVAPPNTWDSMSYHMARVAHWAQNGSVAPFPTLTARQLYLAPFSEYAILHLYLLADGDRLANVVQWLAVLGSAVVASSLAASLGASRAAQALAALFVVTVPTAVLEASSTQTDAVVGLWTTGFAALTVALVRRDEDRGPLLPYAAAGACLGLAVLTKGTAYLYAAPFGVWLGAATLRRAKGTATARLALTVAVALALNAPFLARNVTVYGRPLGPGFDTGPGGRVTLSNESFGIRPLGSNIVRNLALHAGLPAAGFNFRATRAVGAALAGAGIDANDSRTTWPGTTFAIRYSTHEDDAGSPVHAVLAILSLTLCLAGWRGAVRDERLFAACVVAGFVLFCAALKWQPWNSRLHLPLFFLAAPLVALALERAGGPRVWAAAAALMLLTGAHPALRNRSRPLVAHDSILRTPREVQYFANRPELLAPTRRALAVLDSAGCHRVGLRKGNDGWEYPLWALPAGRVNHRLRVRHVEVSDASASTAARNRAERFPICAVVAVESAPADRLVVERDVFTRVPGTDSAVAVYALPAPALATRGRVGPAATRPPSAAPAARLR